MTEDLRTTVDKKIDVEAEHLRLKLEVAEHQYEYELGLRPLIGYRNFLIINLLLLLAGIGVLGILGANTYYGGWVIFITIVLGFLLLGSVIYFLMDITEAGDTIGFQGIARIISLSSEKEDIEKLHIQLRLVDDVISAQRPPKHKYADEITPLIEQYTRKANRNRNLFYTIQIFIIFCSLLVTGLTSGLTGLVKIFSIPWITPTISFAVTFLTAMITLFRFRERSHNQQQTADAIQYEISCAIKGIYGYKKLSEEDAYIKLAEEIERLINEQRKRQQQLEQSSDTSKHGAETT